MNTQHIQYFLDSYRLGNSAKAAITNNVAPSTISQGIRILEQELGYPLTRKKRGVLELTKEGVTFANQAAEIIRIIDSLKVGSVKKPDELIGKIKVATHQSFLNSYLWTKLRKFKKKYPKVEVQIMTGIGSEISDLMESEQIDIAISLDDLKVSTSRSISSQVLLVGNFKLVHAYKYKLDKDAPCVVTNVNKPEVSNLIRHAPWLTVESQLPSWTTIQKVIASEPLFGYIPEYLLSMEGSKVVFKEPRFAASLRFPYQVKMYYQYRQRNNAIIQQFLATVKE